MDKNKIREAELCQRLMSGLEGLVPPAREPDWGPFLHRWGGAFSQQVIPEPRTFQKIGLSVCGDFVGDDAGSVPGAAMSGYHVARAALDLHAASL